MQLTVRGVDDELHAHLKNEAQEAGLSVNRYVLRTLRESVGLDAAQKQNIRHHDLDHLAGTWNNEELIEFNASIADQRGIDTEMWS